MPKSIPSDQRPNISKDEVAHMLRELADALAALERTQNRLRFSLSEKPANDGNG